MRRLCLLSALLFATTAVAAAAAPGGEVDARSRALIRAIRAEEAKPARGTDDLRRDLEELAARPDAGAVASRLARARDLLSLLEDGRPLPPPGPDEADASDELEVAEAQSAAAAAAAAKEARLAELASALSVSAAAGAFDGARSRGVAAPVEYEPAHGYHTVNADVLLSISGKDRDETLRSLVDDLLVKAGIKDKDGKRAKELVGLLAARLDAHPQRRRMRALRLRVLPNGRMALVYRLDEALVVEQELEFGLLPETPAKGKKIKIAKSRKKPKKKGRGADADSGGGGKSGGKNPKVPGAPDFGAGGGPGGVGAAGRGAGLGKSGRLGVSEEEAENEPAAIMPLSPGARVDPDGAGSAGRRGAHAKNAAVPGARSAGAGRTEGRNVGGVVSASARRKAEKEGATGAKDALAVIPDIPHLSGDRPRGRLGDDKSPSAAVESAAGASPSTRAAQASAASPAAALDESADVFEAPLRDAVAADAVAVPAPRAEAVHPASGTDAPAPSSDRAGASAALFTASAALGAAGLLLSRRD